MMKIVKRIFHFISQPRGNLIKVFNFSLQISATYVDDEREGVDIDDKCAGDVVFFLFASFSQPRGRGRENVVKKCPKPPKVSPSPLRRRRK